MAGSLLLGAAGCGGDGDGDGGEAKATADAAVTGTQVCGGGAVSADAARALEVITGSSRFDASGDDYSVEQAAADLVEAFPVPTRREDACRVHTPSGTPDFELRITWRLDDGAPTSAPDPKFTLLKMGERAGAAADSAFVHFACTSDKLSRSTRAAHIVIGVMPEGMPKEPEGDAEALKDAYATVAHSYALAMARELDCEKDGGLPAEPVLDRA